MTKRSTKSVQIIKVSHDDVKLSDDALAIEEPLEIRLEYGRHH